MHQTSPPPLRHTPQKFEVLEDNPFKNDTFERQSQVEKLTKLVQSCTEESFVLAINGVWGSGKSVFLDMWGAHLKQLGFQTLRFNAWENDYSEDPFASVFSEFRKLTEASEKEDERSHLANLYQRAKKMAVPILAKTMGSVVKHATMGMLNINQDAESILGNLAEASAQHALDKAESGKKSIDAFKKELGAFVEKAGTQNKPVVYFIDELDRCRPTYAVSVLERVKHLLNVNGVVFVFAWDRNQLNETIRHVYGQQTDPSGYLFRFVDLEFNLPTTGHDAFCHSLMNRFGLFEHVNKNGFRHVPDLVTKIFPEMAKNLNMSVRDQEKAFTAFSVILRTSAVGDLAHLEHLFILIMLRVKRPDLYHSIRALASYPTDAGERFRRLVEDELPFALGRNYWGSSRDKGFLAHLLYLLPEDTRKAIGKYAQVISPQSQNNPPQRERQLQLAYQLSKEYEAAGGLLVYLINKMEFSARFTS